MARGEVKGVWRDQGDVGEVEVRAEGEALKERKGSV